MTEKNTISIDMDKPCTACGQMGATGSGLCLQCATDQISGGEQLTTEAVGSASRQFNRLMSAHVTQIHRAYLIADDGKLTIGISVELSPSEEVVNAIKVKTKINFIESRIKDESIERVSMQQKLEL